MNGQTIREPIALLNSAPPAPGEDAIIELFAAWPKEWDASFKLLARGGFVVTATIRGGTVESAEVLSQIGGTCRIRNPFTGTMEAHATTAGQRVVLRKA